MATAEEKFIQAIRTAKKAKVDVDKIFLESEERLLLMRVRAVGLGFAIAWCFVGPPITVALVILCERCGVKVDIPVSMVFWTCQALGFVSVLAFGFDLVKVDFNGKGISFRKENDLETTWQHLEAIPVEEHDDGVDGGV